MILTFLNKEKIKSII